MSRVIGEFGSGPGAKRRAKWKSGIDENEKFSHWVARDPEWAVRARPFLLLRLWGLRLWRRDDHPRHRDTDGCTLGWGGRRRRLAIGWRVAHRKSWWRRAAVRRRRAVLIVLHRLTIRSDQSLDAARRWRHERRWRWRKR